MQLPHGVNASRETSTTARRRVSSYWILGVGLTVSYAVVRGSVWQGSAELHTLMEALATMLALVVGGMALVRFYSRKDGTFLIIGTGFLGTGLLDGYHTVATSSYFKDYLPSNLPSLIPWSWIASRLFLSLLLYLSWVAWRRERRLGMTGRIDERTVYGATVLLMLMSFAFSALLPLPRAYYPGIIFHRPEEFGPALFFGLALIGYLHKGEWRRNAFEHWLVLALIVNLVAQVVFMSFSGQLFDLAFDAAHLLKKVGYLCVLIGLFVSMYDNFRQVEREVAERKLAENALQVEQALRASEERLRRELARSNAELQRFNRLAVGRERRMIELKRQVNELLEEERKPPAYDLAFAESEVKPDATEVS